MSCLETLRYLSDAERAPELSEVLSTECEDDNLQACAMLTAFLVDGAGVPQDLSRAFKVGEKACAGSVPSGCNNLARLYGLGVGVAKDPVRAHLYHARACNLGDPIACLNSASHYESGTGVQADLGRATKLYKKACSPTLPLACARLAQLYDSDTRRELRTARPLYEMACKGGIRESCGRLSIICREEDKLGCLEAADRYLSRANALSPTPKAPKVSTPLRLNK